MMFALEKLLGWPNWITAFHVGNYYSPRNLFDKVSGETQSNSNGEMILRQSCNIIFMVN